MTSTTIFYYLESCRVQIPLKQEELQYLELVLLVSAKIKERMLQRCTKYQQGKSSLVIQFCENHFVDSYYPTIENTFTKTIKYRGNGNT